MGSKRLGNKIPEEKLTAFFDAYLASGFNGLQAGMAIGMSKRSANANAHRYVAAIRNRISYQQALDAAGLTPDYAARKLLMLTNAETPKWNPSAEEWDTFSDGQLQLAAVKEFNALRNAYPAEQPRGDRITVNLKVDVSRL